LGEVGISDEMNIHIPQSPEAIAECMILMRAAIHIVTGQRNGPVDGPVQDALVGMYMLTNTWSGENPDTMVSKENYFQMIHASGITQERSNRLMKRAEKYYPDYVKNGKIISREIPGKLASSILLPTNFTYKKKLDTCLLAPIVSIKDGVIEPISGPLCVKAIGAKQCSILHLLWKDYSPEIALRFISEVQQMSNRWLPINGFSVGISDFLPKSKEDVAKAIVDAQTKVAEIIKVSGDTPEAEREINEVLNNTMNVGLTMGKQGMVKDDRNGMNIMRLSGAKGSIINLAQIAGLVGQQNVNGARIPLTLSGGTRALPHYYFGDNSPEARGFVFNSYVSALTPQEFYFHAESGRQGIIATAVKTADTGYIQKRMCKKVEDYSIWIDGSVRDANGRIIQFLYGDDGMDPKKIYNVEGVAFPFFINCENIANMLNSDFEQNIA